MNRFCLALLSILAAYASGGCGNSCKTVDSTPVVYDNMTTPAGGIYLTTPWNGTWLDFPSGREYQLFHHLGSESVYPTPYVAFSPQPMPENGTGNASISPGNQTIIQGVNARYVQVRNDTCEHFYLLVVINGPDTEDQGAAGAAGATN